MRSAAANIRMKCNDNLIRDSAYGGGMVLLHLELYTIYTENFIFSYYLNFYFLVFRKAIKYFY